MLVLGVMSGSSLDGLDVAIVDFQYKERAWDWTLIEAKTIPLQPSLKKRLAHITDMKAFELAQTNSDYSAFISRSINNFLEEINQIPQVAGIHGHTILHLPEAAISWQLLNGGHLAEKTKLPIVCDFRNQDMALGGQGTPMAVLCDRDLFIGYDAYLNLGGIANLSYNNTEEWIGYDLIGCNQFLNHFSAKKGLDFDKNGDLARSGKRLPDLLLKLDSDPYLHQAQPKSLDNSYIKSIIQEIDKIHGSTEDALFTCTEFISTQIAKELQATNIESVLVTGGGTKNTYLIESIESKLDHNKITLTIPEDHIIDYKESILIAYAALLRWETLPNFVPTATGASSAVIGGALYLPANNNVNE